MVAFFPGRTTCALCGAVIPSAEDCIGFPAFLRPDHRLHRYSDAAFHKTCFNEWPDREPFEEVYRRYRQIWDNRPRNLKTLDEIEAWGREAFKNL